MFVLPCVPPPTFSKVLCIVPLQSKFTRTLPFLECPSYLACLFPRFFQLLFHLCCPCACICEYKSICVCICEYKSTCACICEYKSICACIYEYKSMCVCVCVTLHLTVNTKYSNLRYNLRYKRRHTKGFSECACICEYKSICVCV